MLSVPIKVMLLELVATQATLAKDTNHGATAADGPNVRGLSQGAPMLTMSAIQFANGISQITILVRRLALVKSQQTRDTCH